MPRERAILYTPFPVEKAPSDLGYVITGLGRSGTTFLAHVFLNAGYDLGNVKSQDIGKNAPAGGGLEYAPFAGTNIQLQSEVSHLWSASIEESQVLQDCICAREHRA